MKNLYKSLIAGFIGSVALVGCSDADIVSRNVYKAADNFYNDITDTYMLTIEGYCSIGNFVFGVGASLPSFFPTECDRL